MEPVAVRHALAELGARNVVVPKGLAAWIIDDEQLDLAVPDGSLEQALSALKDAEQVVLYFQRWTPWKDTWTRIDGQGWELDWASSSSCPERNLRLSAMLRGAEEVGRPQRALAGGGISCYTGGNIDPASFDG